MRRDKPGNRARGDTGPFVRSGPTKIGRIAEPAPNIHSVGFTPLSAPIDHAISFPARNCATKLEINARAALDA